MKFTPKQYAQTLFEALSETDIRDHEKVLDNFVKVLAQNGDLEKYHEIEREFMVFQLEEQGKKHAEVTLARDMKINESVIDNLNKSVEAELEVKKKVDEGLVGGLIMRVEDKLIDASIKEQLKKLSESLQE